MQRTDYTFKYNENIGRHGWLRLTPAYSIKLVKEILGVDNMFSKTPFGNKKILDPFCGTATTGIVAAELGLDCVLYDINPFLVWFGNIKSANFDNDNLDELFHVVSNDLKHLSFGVDNDNDRSWVPPMKNIERWWADDTVHVLARLRRYICSTWGKPSESGEYNLLWVAFARLVIETSAADFNHISVSFKKNTEQYTLSAILKLYTCILQWVILSAKDKLKGHAVILHGDSRTLDADNSNFDLVVTSPPYPNRISYIRELRPYMYWLGFLETGEQAGDLDWKAIGGTWGSATSRLNSWKSEKKNLPQELNMICSKIENADNKNGKTMSLYVMRFFEDMHTHLSNLRKRLNVGAEINYILGNSSFYGDYVDTETIMKNILLQLGYSEITSTVIRKRNCNKGLFEYKISARWDG